MGKRDEQNPGRDGQNPVGKGSPMFRHAEHDLRLHLSSCGARWVGHAPHDMGWRDGQNPVGKSSPMFRHAEHDLRLARAFASAARCRRHAEHDLRNRARLGKGGQWLWAAVLGLGRRVGFACLFIDREITADGSRLRRFDRAARQEGLEGVA